MLPCNPRALTEEEGFARMFSVEGAARRKGRVERSFRASGWAGLCRPAVSAGVVSWKGGILEKAMEFHIALCIRGWTVGSR